MQFYPPQLSEKIGFEMIRREAIDRTRSVMGEEHLQRMDPSSSTERVERQLDETGEMMDLIRNDAAFPLDNLHDIRESLSRSKPEGALLSAESFLEILQLAATARRVKSFLEDREERYPVLNQLAVELIPLKELEKAINKVISEQGSVKNNASRELQSIRSRLGKRQNDLRNTINKVMSRATKQGMASDEGPTIRNGRMVIPIQAEYKRKIQGFVHDVSSTGQTVYLEPVEALNINNEIRQLESEEKREIERILRTLTNDIRKNRQYLAQNTEVLGKFDMIYARAELSIDLDAFVPVLSDGKYIRLKEAYNPILLLKNRSKSEEEREPVIPLNMELEEEERCLMITGPNAGGKSVAIKTVGLCAMMMQSGFAIPAKDTSELPVFSNIFVDMGDDQSIENDLSTFSSRLQWMKSVMDNADDGSLVLVDEAGAGTDPDEGGALYQSLIEFLIQRGALSLVTTHHGSLKVFAHEHPKAVNGSMEFDQSTLSPTYRFKKGIPGSSYAFEIAQRMDLSADLLTKAREITGSKKQDMESLINELEAKAQEADNLRKDYDRLKKKMESERQKYEDKWRSLEKEKDQIREKALKQAEEIMQSANQRIERAVERIVKEGQKDDQAIKEARKQVAEQKEDIEEELEEIESKQKQEKRKQISEEPPAVGDTVRLMDAKTKGELVEINDNQAVVQAGGLRLKTKFDNLVKVDDGGNKKSTKNRIKVNIPHGARPGPTKPSIEIRGMRGHEAMKEVEHYLDNAIAAGLQSVEIIHGKGEGILKNLVHEYLQERPEVQSFSLAPADRGGAGVTVVKL
ncbi:endonuclease MutS2 [Aliifodinibius sp. S!AR15-10]|uniref:endonuclease MutS2 n=1 Tax=Aliifodinibius sp. S!AR15-10 TaxID=2950437 RepID=UPI0028671DEB|nr:endonuclease MutS2 [Aliifodinibius sp. S!AR15-10]MDR8392503.1 endonuclease MutS2 [Aliifodinibius sp. S!AR15-10]